jgi:hypothetical protein
MPAIKRYLWFIPLLLALAFGLRRSVSSPPSDFAGYYYGGKALLQGQYPGAYDMTTLNDRIAADGYKDVFVSYAPFPPFSSLIVAPFLPLPMHLAKIVFNCFSIAVFLISLFRLTRYLATPPGFILALPVIFFIPLLNNLAFGQSYLLLFALLTEGWLAQDKGRPILSSALWATAILFKLFPAFLFLFLLLRRKYRPAVYLGIACAALLIFSFLVNGFDAWEFYGTHIVPKLNRGELNDSFTYIFQSAFMLLKRAFVSDSLLNPYPITDNPWLFTTGMALFKAGLVSTAILLTLRDKDDFFSFTTWIAAAMLISPNGSSYSLILLLLPLLALIRRSTASLESQALQTPSPSSRLTADANSSSPRSTAASPTSLIIAAVLLAAACTVSVTRLASLPLLAQFPRLYLLLLFYIALLLQQRRCWNGSLFTACALLFFALDIRGNMPAKDPGTYLLTKEEHLFICDYAAIDNRLVYYWRDSEGRHQQSTDYPVHSMTTTNVTLKGNQVWYGSRQLTSSPDRKIKPSLVNGEYIIYLSDKDRGVDFFTLRKIRMDGSDGPPGAAAAPGSSR